MSQTAVKELICDVCGAEVRDGSLFCYNCGTSVTEKVEVLQEPTDDLPTSDTHSNGNLVVKEKVEEVEVLPKREPSAGRVRPRKRPIQNREVVWAERDGMSLGFIVTTVILVLLTAVILIAGFYFR